MVDSAVLHDLPEDHPGFHDRDYRARRAAIASVGETHRSGEPIPDVVYTPEEDDLWRRVSQELAARHERYACREYQDAARRLQLPTHRVPQLREVDALLQILTGFGIQPVTGLVSTEQFFGALAVRRFPATQYLRHHAVPFYTPEPDLIHEVIGHANLLASPAFADLCQAAGQACLRAHEQAALDFFAHVFWFTMEFGVVWEGPELMAYGAGLLSSTGELEGFRSAEIRKWDLLAMGTQAYDHTTYQPVLFAAPSMVQLVDELGALFERFDDEEHERLVGHVG